MYGLLGYPLGHSFSKKWFEEKGYEFQNFECPTVEEFLGALPANLEGFSVTIPHKEAIIPHLDFIDSEAREVGAVNCVAIRDGKLYGYNTDVIGFRDSIKPLLTATHKKAAVLGSGGASKAVRYALTSLGLECETISRTGDGYDYFDPSKFDVIVNTTPLGMYPKVDTLPPIDYSMIRPATVCYDVVYNPEKTLFLELAESRGAVVMGGLRMLELQAEAALLRYAE